MPLIVASLSALSCLVSAMCFEFRQRRIKRQQTHKYKPYTISQLFLRPLRCAYVSSKLTAAHIIIAAGSPLFEIVKCWPHIRNSSKLLILIDARLLTQLLNYVCPHTLTIVIILLSLLHTYRLTLRFRRRDSAPASINAAFLIH